MSSRHKKLRMTWLWHATASNSKCKAVDHIPTASRSNRQRSSRKGKAVYDLPTAGRSTDASAKETATAFMHAYAAIKTRSVNKHAGIHTPRKGC